MTPSSNVTDDITTRYDAYLSPFAAGIGAGAPPVMVSTAYYAKIDAARPAAFSPTVVTGMLRGDPGVTGVVISDDLGNAAQVQPWSPGTRAVDFLTAGGDVVGSSGRHPGSRGLRRGRRGGCRGVAAFDGNVVRPRHRHDAVGRRGGPPTLIS